MISPLLSLLLLPLASASTLTIPSTSTSTSTTTSYSFYVNPSCTAADAIIDPCRSVPVQPSTTYMGHAAVTAMQSCMCYSSADYKGWRGEQLDADIAKCYTGLLDSGDTPGILWWWSSMQGFCGSAPGPRTTGGGEESVKGATTATTTTTEAESTTRAGGAAATAKATTSATTTTATGSSSPTAPAGAKNAAILARSGDAVAVGVVVGLTGLLVGFL